METPYISKVFWPARSAREDTVQRCAHLRRELNIADDSMLRSRKARDAMEHFDERLDKWYRTSERRNFADRIIAAPGQIVGLDAGDYARHYDPESNVVTVSGDSLDFQGLVSEVDALVSVVRERHSRTWWDRT